MILEDWASGRSGCSGLFGCPRARCTPTGLHLASRLQKRPAVRVLKGGRARLSAHAHLQLAAFAGRLVGNQNSYQSEALDISKEPEHVLKLYGLKREQKKYPKEINAEEETEYFGRKCLIARRLIERDVRFVQIWSGNDNSFPRRNWDSHEDIERDHGPLASGMARGTVGLIKDLKQRGLLDDTIIHWTTEFGRMPSTQGSKGRDHNPYVFTNWLCGGGIQGGVTAGESDQWG